MSEKYQCLIRMMRVRNPSILGAFTGCLLTTLVYVVFSGTLSLTWNAQRSAMVTEEFNRREALPNTPFLSVYSDSKDYSTAQKHTSHASATEQGSKQQLVRKMLLNMIATSKDNMEDALHKVNTSWGQDTEEWLMAVGTSNGVHKSDHVFLAPDCEDFPEREYMAPRQLFCLLEAIYKSFYTKYQWFFIATEPIYVSVYQLERHLIKLDSDSEVIYMGRPRAKNSYCIGESGVVLSHTALREIVPLLKTCLDEGSSNTSLLKGDFALGSCFTKLQRTCYEAEDDYVRTLAVLYKWCPFTLKTLYQFSTTLF